MRSCKYLERARRAAEEAFDTLLEIISHTHSDRGASPFRRKASDEKTQDLVLSSFKRAHVDSGGGTLTGIPPLYFFLLTIHIVARPFQLYPQAIFRDCL